MRAEATIVQELLAQYRVPFYERLRELLSREAVRLRLVHGVAGGERASRGDESSLEWAETVANRRVRILRSRPPAIWQQPVLRSVLRSDLVVVEHANRQLVNYPLLAAQRIESGPKVAFWGHGGNLQTRDANSPEERFKRRIARQAHWWFAYTEGSADRVVRAGFPRERITVVNNAVDTSVFPANARKEPLTCIFVGGLHEHKRLDFLMEAAARVANSVPGFRLIVVGAGEKRHTVEGVAEANEWLDYRGSLFGKEKAELIARASLMLMPGLVGLAVVDSFAGKTPIVTTNIPIHSPEFEYLENERNGVILPANVDAVGYASALTELLTQPNRLDKLMRGCDASSRTFTLDKMAERYAQGVLRAIYTPRA